jgi:hypothetical protein
VLLILGGAEIVNLLTRLATHRDVSADSTRLASVATPEVEGQALRLATAFHVGQRFALDLLLSAEPEIDQSTFAVASPRPRRQLIILTLLIRREAREPETGISAGAVGEALRRANQYNPQDHWSDLRAKGSGIRVTGMGKERRCFLDPRSRSDWTEVFQIITQELRTSRTSPAAAGRSRVETGSRRG